MLLPLARVIAHVRRLTSAPQPQSKPCAISHSVEG
jgi:hypothetical protein